MPEKYLFITVSNDKYIHHHSNFKDKVYKPFIFMEIKDFQVN